jgi:hypothetical protein
MQYHITLFGFARKKLFIYHLNEDNIFTSYFTGEKPVAWLSTTYTALLPPRLSVICPDWTSLR